MARQEVQLQVYWAIAEAAGLHDALWQDAQMQRLPTGGGGLGERMHRVYHTLLAQHDAVLLLGMDSPQNTPDHLLQAAHWLQEAGHWSLARRVMAVFTCWAVIVRCRCPTGPRLPTVQQIPCNNSRLPCLRNGFITCRH
ncbi:MAG: DUF2064 domain-containing protein [Thiolinea sp.]